LPEKLKIIDFPDLERINYMRWHGIAGRMRDPQNFIVAERLMYETLMNGGTVWEVHQEPKWPNVADRIQKGEDQRVAEVVAAHIIWRWLSDNATARGSGVLPGIENTMVIEKFSPPMRRRF